MNALRRTLLRAGGASGLLLAALAAGVLKPRLAVAAEWQREAFEARELAEVLQRIDAARAEAHDGLVLRVAEFADDATMVPVDLVSRLPGTERLALAIERNPFPLAASFDLPAGTLAEISLRVRLAETTGLRAYAWADGKVYVARREVRVGASGCD